MTIKDIEEQLQRIKSRPVKLPYQITPSEAAVLIRERDILLLIAIAQEKENKILRQDLVFIVQKKTNQKIRIKTSLKED